MFKLFIYSLIIFGIDNENTINDHIKIVHSFRL